MPPIKAANIYHISLLCNYRFDEEHGIAITYENEKLKNIGPQDDVL